MACNGTGCQSGCYKDTTGDQHDNHNNSAADANADDNNRRHRTTCLKCKATEATVFTGGDGGGRFCADCFRSNLYGKFKLAVTSNAMISPTDKVLVAFSGGPSSRVALQFVSEMQLKAQKNYDATANRDRSLPVFAVGVAFIDESEIHPVASAAFDKAVEDIKEIVSNLPLPTKELHVAPISHVYSTKTSDGKQMLRNLTNSVSDATGKEDLLTHLRMLSLQKVAIKNGYTKLVLGSCTSRIACHVLSATVKGQGYSLAADIQYADARIPEANVDDADLVSQRRQKKFNLKPIESLPPESFCPICNSPMSCYGNAESRPELFRAACCPSCQYQILPDEASSMDQFYSFLPESIIARAKNGNQKWIREKIQDCLLLDDEDEV